MSRLDPYKNEPTWTRISLRPTPVPSSSSNELALPRKQITPFNRVFQVIFCGVSKLTNSPLIKRLHLKQTLNSNRLKNNRTYVDISNLVILFILQYDPNKPTNYKFPMVQHCNNHSRYCCIWQSVTLLKMTIQSKNSDPSAQTNYQQHKFFYNPLFSSDICSFLKTFTF